MDPVARAALTSWSWRPEVIIPLVILAALFLVGWRRLRARGDQGGRASDRSRLGATWRPVSYVAGLLVVALALLSPFDVLVQQLFFMHMIQHLLLIMIAPPLLLLPNPLPILLWGLPGPLRLRAGGALNSVIHKQTMVGRGLRLITRPVIIWFIFVATVIGWHDPALYNAALSSEIVHDLEHLTMFGAGMLFWWVVTGAGPRLNKNLSRPAKIGFILAVIPPNMALGIVLAFSQQPIYSFYNDMPRLWGISALDDQRISGIIMWIPGNMMYFLAALVIIFLILSGEGRKRPPQEADWAEGDALVAPGIAAGGGRS